MFVNTRAASEARGGGDVPLEHSGVVCLLKWVSWEAVITGLALWMRSGAQPKACH